MRIGVTGATGFLGRYIARRLTAAGHDCRCWYRASSNRDDMGNHAERIEWVEGTLSDPEAAHTLVEGCDAVVHSALHHQSGRFTGGEGADLLEFAEQNVLGTLRMIEAARTANVGRFVFISTCAVHDRILDDRPLDEAHPLWPHSHYGAHKAAIEKFIHSYGYGGGYPICSLRPTGIYGLATPPEDSRWYELVKTVARGGEVTCEKGGKEVHAADVAKAVELLLSADGVAGEAYNCYDMYISQYDVATRTKEITGSDATIHGAAKQPKNQIQTGKIRELGMQFGGEALLDRTLREMVATL